MEILGWVCTLLVLIGYILNSNNKLNQAIIVWLIGDIGWIIYDIYIDNWSHACMAVIIICINLYGMYRIFKNKKYEVTIRNQI